MIEEEINKIAKRFELDMYPTMPDMLSCKAMLEWLLKDYCIVPKYKVIELYNKYDAIGNEPERPKDYIESRYEEADGICIGLEELFGSELFDHKGE